MTTQPPPSQPSAEQPTCFYCGMHDHTGREHFQFAMSLSDDPHPESCKCQRVCGGDQ